MDIERFYILTEIQKKYYTHDVGVFLASRLEKNALIQLFAVGNFYVEFIYPLNSFDEIKAQAFTSILRLEPYLVTIDIEYLLQ
jgi:hypothetical protein